MRNKILAVVTALAAVGLLAAAGGPNAVALFVLDNFDDGTLNPGRWETSTAGTGVTASEASGSLQFDFAADSANPPGGDQFNAFYHGRCDLHGDFDLQIDFDLLDWPEANGVRLSMFVGPYVLQRVSFGSAIADFPGYPREEFVSNFDNNLTFLPTDQMSGKFRLQRTGTTVSGCYFDGVAWATIDQRSDATTDDLSIDLGAWSHDYTFADAPVSAQFDNLTVNVGDVTCALINGDNDCDGDVDGRDALIAFVHESGATQLPRGSQCPDLGGAFVTSASVATGPTLFGDVNCNDAADAGDGMSVLKYIAGVAPPQPEGCVAIGDRLTHLQGGG